MQYKSFMQVVEEARDLHQAAQNAERWTSKDDRARAYGQAERCYHWLLEQQPESAYVLGALGSLYVEIGKWSLGCALLLSAARIDPKEVSYWNALGAAYRRMDMLEKARSSLQKALGLSQDDEDRVRVMHNMASTYVNEGEPEKAVHWATEALKLDPTNKTVRFNLGLAQLELGDYANGWDGYEFGRMATTWARNYSHPGRDVVPWDGSPGKNVVVFGEQGVGDEILFAHAIPDLIKVSQNVVIECHPRLVSLFKRSFPGCPVYGTRKDEAIDWPANHALDAKVPFGSLHRFFRRDKSQFPVYPNGYIKPDPAYVGEYASAAGVGNLRVGISWIGGTRDTHVRSRSMPLEAWAPILKTKGVEFHSLQYTEHAAEEVADIKAAYGYNITHDDVMNKDLDRLFGFVKGLDLVITVLTSNVHFAGSMNVPTWVLTPIKAPWQFMQESMPWYPNTKLVRQQKPDDWDGVINTIARDLRYAVEAKRAVG